MISFGGGILNGGELTVTNSTLSGNGAQFGGGIYNTESGMLTVQESELCDNFASLGADLYNAGELFLINSIVCDLFDTSS